jgi:hypothetical protein
MAPLFADWSARWMKRRLDAHKRGDQGQEEFCKLILTSLAGKFGQRGEWWRDAKGGPARRGWGRAFTVLPDTKQVIQWRWIAGHVQRKVPGDEPLNAFPAISAFVTSAAREYMRNVFALFPPESLLYTATDSIICTDAGRRALRRAGLVHPTQPGQFKPQGTFRGADIRGPNWYRLGRRWTIAGYHGQAKKGKRGRLYADIWDSLAGLLDDNPQGTSGFSRVELGALVPTLKNADAGDGWRQPFRFTPDHEWTDRGPRKPHTWFKE